MIAIHTGSWITFKNLISITFSCHDILICGSLLNCVEINALLCGWMEKLLDFGSIIISMKNVDPNIIYKYLEKNMITVESNMVYQSKGNIIVFAVGHNVIQRDDGKIAVFGIRADGLSMIATWDSVDSAIC
uniref:FBA_2 domain-containing protein n=1 Tax=Caenorhabditis tropicalis TaxID=1561998 RepID=A0A1I7UFV9_9PELO